MKTFLTVLAITSLLLSCKDKETGTTVVTTEEITDVDTLHPKVRTTTVVTETVETDTSETTITTGGVRTEPINEEESQ